MAYQSVSGVTLRGLDDPRLRFTYTTPAYGNPDFASIPPAFGSAPAAHTTLPSAVEDNTNQSPCVDPRLIFGAAPNSTSSTTPNPESASTPASPVAAGTDLNSASDLFHGMDKDLAYSLCKNRKFPVQGGRLRCPIAGCESTFTSKQSVVRHIWERTVVCDRCGQSFKRAERSTIDRHHKTAKCRAAATRGRSGNGAGTKQRHRKDDSDGDENYDPSSRSSKRRRLQ